MKIYDENASNIEIENIDEDSNLISILEIQGINCSPRGFQIEIEIKQILVLKKETLFDNCILIKKHTTSHTKDDVSISLKTNEEVEEVEDVEDVEVEDVEDASKVKLNISSIVTNEFMNEPDLEDNYSNTLELNLEKDDIDITENNNTELLEINLNLEKIPQEDTVIIKKRNDVFYEMYKEAMKKAKMAKDLALSSYLEAKRIKNTHMLEEITDESDFDEESLNFSEDE